MAQNQHIARLSDVIISAGGKSDVDGLIVIAAGDHQNGYCVSLRECA